MSEDKMDIYEPAQRPIAEPRRTEKQQQVDAPREPEGALGVGSGAVLGHVVIYATKK